MTKDGRLGHGRIHILHRNYWDVTLFHKNIHSRSMYLIYLYYIHIFICIYIYTYVHVVHVHICVYIYIYTKAYIIYDYTICTHAVVCAGASHCFHQVVSCKINQQPRRKNDKMLAFVGEEQHVQTMALSKVWGLLFGHLNAGVLRKSPRKRRRRKKKSGGRWGNAARIVWSKWTKWNSAQGGPLHWCAELKTSGFASDPCCPFARQRKRMKRTGRACPNGSPKLNQKCHTLW